jgi:hypothetical protein
VYEYPLFEPPKDLVERGIRNWSTGDADRYREWLLSVTPVRVRTVRESLRLSRSRDPESVLEQAGTGMAELLARPDFFRMSPPGTAELRGRTIAIPAAPELTPLGYAVAADLGLLMATYLCEGYPLHWETVRKPKSDVSYNMPVLTGFESGIYVDPVRLSTTLAAGVLTGHRDQRSWADSYRWWAAKAAVATSA